MILNQKNFLPISFDTMTTKKFSLQVQSSVANIPYDFTFIVGNKEYQCPKISAINHCRAVQNLLLCDSTSSELIVGTPDEKGYFEKFNDFIINGKCNFLNQSNFNFFRNLSVELQCEKLCEQISAYNKQNTNIQVVLKNLFDSSKLYQKNVEKYLKTFKYELIYIASKLSEIIKSQNYEKLYGLPLEALEVILEPKNRCSVSPSDLFSLVYKIVKQNERSERSNEYLSLFSQVPFEQIDSQDAKKFFEMIKGKEVSGALWLAMTKRLKCNVK